MPLQPQKIGFPFVQGEDTKTDPKQVIAGKLLSMQNGVLTSPKQIQKRLGNTALSQNIEPSGTISTGKGIAAFEDELDLMDGTGLYAYNRNTDKYDLKGTCVSNEVTTTNIFKDLFNFNMCDVAYNATANQYLYIGTATYLDSAAPASTVTIDFPYYTIVDGTTGEEVVSFVNLFNTAGALSPWLYAKAFAVGNYFIIAGQATTGDFSYVSIPTATPLSPNAPVVISTDCLAAITGARFDGCIIGTSLYLAWANETGGVNLATISSALVVSAVTTVAGANANVSLNCFADSVLSQLWVAYTSTAPTVNYFVRDSALGSVLAITVIEAVSAFSCTGLSPSSGVGVFYYSRNPAVDLTKRYYYTVTASSSNAGAVVAAPSIIARSVQIAAKPWRYNSVNYLPVIYMGLRTTGAVNQGTTFVINQSGVVVAKAGMSLCFEMTFGISNTVNPSTGVYSMVSLTSNQTFLSVDTSRIPAPPATILYTTGVSAFRINFLSSTAYQTTQAGNSLLITGGILQSYDGGNISEYNFNVYPEMRSADITESVGTGVLTLLGLYSYVVTYEWMDAFGQLHISNTSNIIQFQLTGANRTLTLVIPTLKLTQKGLVTSSNYFPNPVTIGIYRTVANSSGPFYKISSGNTINLSSTTTNTLTFVDGAADTTITAFQQLYTTGGVVTNSPPPAVAALTTYNQRVIALPSETKTQFWYSQQVVPGTPVTFSAFFTWNVDTAGGDLTAFLQMDDKLILWKARNIMYMVGQGPGTNGANNDFTTPQTIPTDVGTNSQRSVCMTPIGAIFKSLNGWYLLDRSLSVKYIGADVESYNGIGVTKTVLVPGVTQVRAYLDNGSVLVFDYYLNQWYHFSSITTVDAVVSQDLVKVVNSSGLVWKETPGTYTDNTAFVGMSIQTSWLQFADVQGFQRLWMVELLGTYKSSHTLRVEIAYDFDPTVAQTVDIPVTSSVVPYQFLVTFTKQKCQAIRLTISDVQNGAAGESFSLSALTFYFGIKQGLRKLPAASSYS